jgi:tetratricopeptide (TPR) repeat protein
MLKKGNLFLLVKSLTKSEKRYFRLYAAVGGSDTNYLRLFDAIDAQQNYDEAAIRHRFEGETFINQLHVTKIYLSDLILKALRNFHAGSSVNATVLDLLRDVELLFDKELYGHCLLKLKKAEQLCRRYEKLPLLAEVLAWQRRLLLAQAIPAGDGVTALLADERAVISDMTILNGYWDKTLGMHRHINNADFIKGTDIRKATTLQAKTLHHHLWYTWHFVNGKPAKGEAEIGKLIALLESDETRIEDDPSSYITVISNLIGMYIGQKRWQEIPPLLQKMRDVPRRFRLAAESKFTVRLWLRLYNLELEMYRDMRQPAAAKTVIAEVEAYMQAHTVVIPAHYRIMLLYQVAALYFMEKDYRHALDKVNDIINYNYGDTRTELQCYPRILNMLIHFELGNITVLRYAVHNCRRFFTKMKASTPFNKDILQMFSSLSLARKDEYPDIVKKAIAKCFSDNTPPAIQDYIDIRSWMESKLTRKGA